MEINLNLINYVINDMHLKYLIDEIIDIGYIGYTKALNAYSEEKGSFTNFAYNCIKYEILKYLNGKETNKRIINNDLTSLNTKLPDEDKELICMVKDNFDLEDTVTKRIQIEEIKKMLKEELSGGEYLLFKLLFLDDYSTGELADMFGISYKYFWWKKKKIINTVRRCYKEEE